MEDITIADAEKSGIICKHSILNSGEKRFRQICLKDNSAYIRAEGKEVGYWQNSHFHKFSREFYIIQNGAVLVATYINNNVIIHLFSYSSVISIFALPTTSPINLKISSVK